MVSVRPAGRLRLDRGGGRLPACLPVPSILFPLFSLVVVACKNAGLRLSRAYGDASEKSPSAGARPVVIVTTHDTASSRPATPPRTWAWEWPTGAVGCGRWAMPMEEERNRGKKQNKKKGPPVMFKGLFRSLL